MRTDVLQVVALAAHGNAFLSDKGGGQAPKLHASNSTFRQVHELTFERRAATPIRPSMAPECTGTWLEQMKAEGATLIRPVLDRCPIDPRQHSHLPWGLLVDTESRSEVWAPTWWRRSADSEDGTPWRVAYEAQRVSRWEYPEPIELAAALSKLDEAICMALEFVMDNSQRTLTPVLQRCLAIHRSGEAQPFAYQDALPEGSDPAAVTAYASALLVLTFLEGSALAEALAKAPDLESQFHLNSGRLWFASMKAFESAALASAFPAAQPNTPSVERQAS